MYEAMLEFGRGVGQYAGKHADRKRVAAAGINAVFHWWCAKGPRGTDYDKRDVAAEIAADAAEQFGFDPAMIEALMPQMMHQWSSQRCRNGRLERHGAYGPYGRAPFDPSMDRVPQNRPLNVPSYRFSFLPM
jgi:hypothetical protein